MRNLRMRVMEQANGWWSIEKSRVLKTVIYSIHAVLLRFCLFLMVWNGIYKSLLSHGSSDVGRCSLRGGRTQGVREELSTWGIRQ